MDYSPWSSKNLIDRNQLKKLMQVGVDVKCMHTNFGECSLSNFGDIATLKKAKFPFPTMVVKKNFLIALHLKIAIFSF